MKNTSSSVHMNNILHPESTAVTSLTEFEKKKLIYYFPTFNNVALRGFLSFCLDHKVLIACY